MKVLPPIFLSHSSRNPAKALVILEKATTRGGMSQIRSILAQKCLTFLEILLLLLLCI